MLNFKRFQFSLLFILIILPIGYAETIVKGETIDNPFLAKEVTINAIQSGEISVKNGNLRDAEINLTTPQENEYQDVAYSDNIITDELGNKLVNIKIQNPPSTFTYSSSSEVTVRDKYVYSLPIVYTVPEDVKRFIEPTENIQSNNSEIKGLAEQITRNSGSDFEKVAKLAIWVNEYVTYDLDYADVAKDAVWVLNNKRGVCAEYSTLFTAFVRSLGIPARYTSVYAYGEDGWESHAITEVYLGKWVTVDPLWLQVGHVDATHVKYTVQLDNKVINSVNVFGTSVDSIDWGEDSYVYETKSVKYNERYPDFYLDSSAYNLEMGDKFIVYGRFKTFDYRVLDLSLLPCSGITEIISIENPEKKPIMSADKEKFVVWEGSVNENLAENMRYVCPLTLNSRYYEIRNINISVSPEHEDKVELNAKLSKNIVNLGKEQEVFLDIKRINGDEPVRIGFISGNNFKEEIIDPSSDGLKHLTFSFTPDKRGPNKIYVYSSSGELEVLDYEVVERGDILIDKIEIPPVRLGDEVEARIFIKNESAGTQNLKLYFSNIIKNVVVENESVVAIPLDSSEKGTQRISIKLTGDNVNIEQLKEIVVYDVPEISVRQKSYKDGIANLEIKIGNDEARNIVIEINGNSETIESLFGKKEVEFEINPRKYNVNVNYGDLGGNEYSEEIEIKIKGENVISRIIRGIKEFIIKFFK